jgi:hypothetical protein
MKLMRKLLKEYGFVPDKLVTNELRAYKSQRQSNGVDGPFHGIVSAKGGIDTLTTNEPRIC